MRRSASLDMQTLRPNMGPSRAQPAPEIERHEVLDSLPHNASCRSLTAYVSVTQGANHHLAPGCDRHYCRKETMTRDCELQTLYCLTAYG